MVSSSSSPTPHTACAACIVNESANTDKASKTSRSRGVLRLRFEEDLTQAEIGELIGVSQMQVSRIIRQSVARLRSSASARQKP